MSDRNALLQFGVQTLLGGRSLDVVGMRGSGRTLFLTDVANRLGDEGWRTLWVRGNASLANTPFGALQTAGVTLEASKTGKPALSVAVDALLEVAGDQGFACVIDNWNDLDESSWGALEAVRERTRHPIVLSRLQGREKYQTPSGLHPVTSASAFVVNIGPLRFDELKRMVESHVGGPVDPAVLTRIYAKSGGLAGIAMVMVEAGLLNSRLVEQGGTWYGKQNLWSEALNGITEEYLELLSDDERDAVALIALAGNCDIETVREVAEWSVLEALESRALIRTYPSGERQLVTLYPPVLVEYMHSHLQHLKRTRLSEVLLRKLGAGQSTMRVMSPSAGHTGSMDDAVFVRLVHERTLMRVHIAQAEWARRPSATTATEYVRALIANTATDDDIAAVFATAHPEGSDLIAEAKYLALRAEWLAFGAGGLDAALDVLASAPERWGEANRIIDAWAVTFQCALGSIPADYATKLEITPGLPVAVEVVLLRAQIHVLIAVGRFADAMRAFDRIDALSLADPGYIPDALCGLALLGAGNAAAARARVQRGFDEARGALDLEAMRTHAAVLVYLLEVDGQYDKADEVLQSALTGGAPPRKLTTFAAYTVLEVTAALVAARRGHEAEAGARVRGLSERAYPDGPLPHQSTAIVEAQLRANEDDPGAAADLLWDRGQLMRERGLLLSAVLTQLASLEVQPHEERRHIVVREAAHVEGQFVSVMVEYLDFVADAGADAEQACDLAPRLVAAGRSGYALATLDLAIRREQGGGHEERVRELLELKQKMAEALPSRRYEIARFSPLHAQLTEREAEVAYMIADGMKNPQIADLLVLSVRTVETHIRRILRKTGTRDRREIIEYVRSRG